MDLSQQPLQRMHQVSRGWQREWFNGPMTASESYLNPEGSAPRSEFAAISQPRAHDFVVEQIRRQIGLGIIAPGTALPPERELMRMLGVGRATVQLAIGHLEAEHIVETRRGRTGGSFVKAPNSDAHALDYRVVELRRQAGSVLEAVEYREVLEPAATAMAAEKAKRKQVKSMTELVQRTAEADNDAEFMRWDTAFHMAIAEATGPAGWMMVFRWVSS